MAKNEIPLSDWMAERDKSVAERFTSHDTPVRKPLTDNHRLYQQSIAMKPVTICSGVTGSGKTTLACEVAARLLREGKVKKIVLTRPLIGCGPAMGYFPGGPVEKLLPYLAPLYKALKRFFGETEFEQLTQKEIIQILPLELMRGESFHETIILADECQNASYEQLKMLFSRIGEKSRMVVSGDTSQSDIDRGRTNPLDRVMRALYGSPDIRIMRMEREDVLRSGLISWIDERLNEYAED